MATVGDGIVTVNITDTSTTLQRSSFGFQVLLSQAISAILSGRTRLYSNIDEVSIDWTTLTDQFKGAQAIFAQDPAPQSIKIGEAKTGDADVAATLAAIVAEDDDWYVLNDLKFVKADALLAAAFVSTRVKLFIHESNDVAVKDSGSSTDIAAELQTANRVRSMVIYHEAVDEFLNCALTGNWLGLGEPDATVAITRYLGNFSGIPADALLSSERTNVHDKNANSYTDVSGKDVFQKGTVATGKKIDLVRGADFLETRIAEDVFDRISSLPAVGYTQDGANLIGDIVDARLNLSVPNLLAPGSPSVTVPRVATVPQADKDARILRNVDFTGTFTGAIEEVDVKGTVSV